LELAKELGAVEELKALTSEEELEVVRGGVVLISAHLRIQPKKKKEERIEKSAQTNEESSDFQLMAQ
jgi:hypothetical protein